MRHDGSRRVCVVGAGIAGLVTAKVLREDGFDVAVFEKLPAIGGVWAPSRAYPGLCTNNSRESYAFSDFPYPPTADDFPTAEQVRAYLASYVEHFRLTPFVRVSTEVLEVSRTPAPDPSRASPFMVTFRATDGAAREVREPFDFVVVCNGVFSHPYVPHIPGRERFAGQVLHSSQVIQAPPTSGSRVVVVGGGKSAVDCAAWAARHCRACTLVCRSPHWMLPRYFFGIRADRLILTRFFELFLPYHSPNRFESFLHGPAKRLVRLWWQLHTRLLRQVPGVPETLLPDRALPAGIDNVGIGVEFYDLVRRGAVSARRGRVVEFDGPSTIVLETGERLEADCVVFATGWRQCLDFLDAGLREDVWKDGKFNLYRHILPPRETRLGLVGYASSVACQLTSEIAAHWLSACFRGELKLPAPSEMEREIARVLGWLDDTLPGRPDGYFVGPFLAHYLDDLMRDMRLNARRSPHGFAEYFTPIWPSRYRGVGAERRARVNRELLVAHSREVATN